MKTPIEELMEDHQAILRMLGVLRGLCARLEQGEAVEKGDLQAAIDFIKTFADYCHHGKEEDLLFPAMEQAGIPSQGGPIAVMLMEHEQGRQFVRELTAAASPKDAARAARGYAELLENHIFKEDNILYPMAQDAVGRPAWKELEMQFARVEKERMGPEKRAGYLALIERLAAAYPDPEPVRPAGRCH